MNLLLQKLKTSIIHLQCLDDTLRAHSNTYKTIDDKINIENKDLVIEISREIYAGGKSRGNSSLKLNRQMILGDIIEYIFAGRAYYYASDSADHFNKFSKLLLYCVNQLLLFDTITIYPELRKYYIEELEKNIDPNLLYEKDGDKELANELKNSKAVIWDDEWKKYDIFVDSLLPKTLGCPKELIVFLELIRLNIGLIVPLLLIQRLMGEGNSIAPPDFLILLRNKEIFGIELGYSKEGQSREFNLRTSIPTFAVDLHDNMHNRCPKCGENILYCDVIIQRYSDGTLFENLNDDSLYRCFSCNYFNNGQCQYSVYYGCYEGNSFYGKPINSKKPLHYHLKCVRDGEYSYYREKKKSWKVIKMIFSLSTLKLKVSTLY